MSVPEIPATEKDIRALVIRTGVILRKLRDSVQEVGLDEALAEVAGSIPDARARLGYVVSMTEAVANNVLNSIERTQPGQSRLEESARRLTLRWDAWFSSPGSDAQSAALAVDTRAWLAALPVVTGFTRQQLQSVMMAQGFQDLTGQVIQRMMNVLSELERQLVQVLRDNVPVHPHASPPAQPSQLQQEAAPASQGDVDDLLASLGL